ncbi:Protein of unknown function [Tissierella praeacuta DSM 18095]|uniref:DUF3798 domain-containing protein n=1 Tax=Tissierella praeacuta DSM 18095 TaxID=1123404 RepID=A0A1M4TNC7_9FIRM|nr:DUF3798 domain-containing protein [Tissierella praeacuta]TCU77431.1 uncharacterized protein DUF3798 [Tissierella praeacuta]SHE45961.1 Protein of unknown function [Tissierella praeacuta DSM 18095]SUP04468.1 Protein of uncharacterised function (DUF3798) [Tissierella praeacuta]
MKKIIALLLSLMLTISLVACQGKDEVKNDSQVVSQENVNDESNKIFKIGIVTPTLSTSEDEFRAGAEMVEKYPDIVKHITLPENFNAELETGISQILSLADDPEMKAIIVNSGQSGLLPAFEKIKEKRPDILTIATMMDEPELMAKYVDINFSTDWARRGVTIPTKAKEMGAKTFIHYSFPTHLAKEAVATRKDAMEKTCKELGLEFVEIITPDPQTGDGPAAMQQFLREDIPRQIAKYGPDTNIFGSNCPMYDVILDEALKLKYTVAEQCCPTPTQAYPTVMNLEIEPEDLGNYDKINDMIAKKAAEAGMTGRLSGWAMPSQIYVPKFEIELAKYIIENNLELNEDILNKEFLDDFSEKAMGVRADFKPLDENTDNYFMLILESIYY